MLLTVFSLIQFQAAQVSEGQAIANADRASTAQRLAEENSATSQANFARSESLRLASSASALLEKDASAPEVAALLSIRALNIAYSPQAEAALSDAVARYYARQVYAGPTGDI